MALRSLNRGKAGDSTSAGAPARRIEDELEREDQPQEAADFYRLKRAPFGQQDIPLERYLPAMAQASTLPVYSTRLGAILPGRAPQALAAWTALGPGNIGGRTRSLLIDPTNPSVMYAGSVGGGVWKTTNAGSSWTALTNLLPNIAVSSMAMDPANSQVLYAGTGEGFFNADALRGAGIFKTVNGGASWTALANTTANANFYFVNDIVVSPNSSLRVYAATRTGVWRSLDGGTTWASVLSYSGLGCTDLAVRTGQATDYIFAACGNSPASIYRNTDAAGAGTWNSVFTNASMGRTSLAIAPSNQSVIYAMSACAGSNCGNFSSGLFAVFRSTVNGDATTWQTQVDNKSLTALNTALLSNPRELLCSNPPGYYNQGWYDNVLAVDPLNSNIVWAGGIDLFRSDDGGLNWALASHWDRSPLAHADQHAIVFHPQYDGSSNQQMFVGNDGGIFRTTNARAAGATGATAPCVANNISISWTSLNNNYAVTQFYYGVPYPNGSTYFGGSQDNGTLRGTDAGGSNAWVAINGGDGGFVAVDPNNTNTIYAETTRLSILRSTTGGGSWTKITSGITEPTGNFLFIAPFTLDPANSQRLWIGAQYLWRTNNQGTLWSQASPQVAGGTISYVGVSPSDSNNVLAGTTSGYIHRLTNGGSSNQSTAWATTALPRNGYVSWIAFDPSNTSTVYATYSNFNSVAGDCHLYRSLDGGYTWNGLAGCGASGLPDVPFHSVVVDPSNSSRIYVGTDLGVFVSSDGGATWAQENTGFANVSTDALAINTAGGAATLYAFTHGLGAWRVPLGNFCSYSISPVTQPSPAAGGAGMVTVSASPGCGWTAVSNATWITVTAGASGNGNGAVSYSVAANPGAARTGTITIAGQTFTISQAAAGCTYSLSPTSQAFAFSGGTGSIGVTAGPGCAWTAASNDGWITVTAGASGTGNGTVTYSVATNPVTGSRTGTITVAGQTFTVSQAALSGAGGNDEISGATLVTTLPYTKTQTTTAATENSSDPVHSCSGSRDSKTVWFRLVPTASGVVQVNTTGSNYDTLLTVYTGATSVGPELVCNDDISTISPQVLQSAVTFNAVAGQSYLIEASGFGASSIGGTLVINISNNDEIAGATVIGSLAFSVTQDTRFATVNASDPAHSCAGGRQDSKTVWFSFVAGFTGRLQVNTSGSDYDTVLSAYGGSTSVGPELACNDDANSTLQSSIVFNVVNGQSYLIEASAFGSAGGGGTLVFNAYGNDEIGGASLIGSLPYNALQDTQTATSNASDPLHSCSSGSDSKTVWFRYVADSNGAILATTFGSDYDTVLSVYFGSSSAGAEIGCNDDAGGTRQSQVVFGVVAGQSYLIEVSNFGTSGTGGNLVLNVSGNNPVTNDEPAAATLISAFPFSASQVTRNATSNVSDPVRSCASGQGGRSVWFRVAPNFSGSIQVNTAGSNYDSVLTAYSGTTAPGAELACNDDANGTLQSAISFNVTSGQSYLIEVSAFSSSSTGDNLVFNATATGACTYSVAPSSQSFTFSAGSGSINVTAPGGCPWSVTGVPGWITVTSGGNGTGSGVVSYSVAVNSSTSPRSAALNIQGQTVTISQAGLNGAAPVSVDPQSGIGTNGVFTFTFTFTDPAGFTDISSATALFNSLPDGRNGCFIYFDRASNAAFLINNAGTGSTRVDLGSAAMAQNSQCILSGTGSSSFGSGPNLTLVLAITFKGAFAGDKTIYASAQNAAGLSSGFQGLGSWIVVANNIPGAVSVTPGSGGGRNQTFSFVFTDSSGFGSLASGTVLINSALDGKNACFIYIDRAANAAYLINDAGTGSTRVDLGLPQTAQNSQCVLFGGGSSSFGSGDDYTVNLALTFKPPFAGAKNIYMGAQDVVGSYSVLRQLGTWSVSGIADQAPSVVSVTPGSGAGASQTFAFVLTDPDGAGDVQNAVLIVNAALDARNACAIYFDRLSGAVFLINDGGNGSTRIGLATSDFAQNSQCSVSGSGSSVTASANSLTLNVAMTFKPAFNGLKNIYATEQDMLGLSSPLQSIGTYTVLTGNNAPGAVAVSPASGNGRNQTFSFVMSDTSGFASLASGSVLINAALNGVNACFLYFDRAANSVYLINDASTASTRVNLGTLQVAQNSQCIIFGGGSSSSGSGNNLTLTLSLTFKPGFAGAKNVYLSAQDAGGLSTGLRQLGNWVVPATPNQPPTNVSMIPASGSGASQTFSFAFADPDGLGDVQGATVLINSAFDGRNGCVVYFDRLNSALFLINDASTASTRVGLGSSTTAQNSQCTVSGLGSSAAVSGNNLIVNVALTFKPAFTGAKTAFVTVVDMLGLSSGPQALGSWSVP